MPKASQKKTEQEKVTVKEDKLPGSLSSHPAVQPPAEHHFKLIMTLVVIFGLIVLGYWLYEYVYWSPERAFSRVGNFVSGLNTYESKRSLTQTSGSDKNSTTFEGAYRQKGDANNPYVELVRQVGLGSFGKPVFSDSQVKFNASQKAEGSEFTETGELRSLDSTYYIKFDTLPSLLGSFLEQYKGKWYSRKANCLLGQNQTDEISKFLGTQKFITEAVREKKDQGTTRKFKGQLNKQAVISVFEKENDLAEGSCKKSGEEMSEMRESINQSMGNITVVLSMSRAGYTITLNFNMAIADKNYDVISTESFVKLNQSVTVEAPGGATEMPGELGFIAALLFGGPAALDFDFTDTPPTNFEQAPPVNLGPGAPPGYTPPSEYYYQAPTGSDGQQGSSEPPEENNKIAGLIDRPEILPENPIV